MDRSVVSVRALVFVLLLSRVQEVSDWKMVVLDGGFPSNWVRRIVRSAIVRDILLS